MLERRIRTAATGRARSLCLLTLGAVALTGSSAWRPPCAERRRPPAAGRLAPARRRATATEIIPANVSAGGVDLSNLSVDAAAAKLVAELSHRLSAQIVVGAEGRVFA